MKKFLLIALGVAVCAAYAPSARAFTLIELTTIACPSGTVFSSGTLDGTSYTTLAALIKAAAGLAAKYPDGKTGVAWKICCKKVLTFNGKSSTSEFASCTGSDGNSG